MTPAEPPTITGFTPERRNRIPAAEPAVFRATAMVVAPVSAYRRALPIPPAPVRSEVEARTSSPSEPARREDDLDRIMVKLKAAAAKAQALPTARKINQQLLIMAAIVLAMISGAVAAQYLVPGHMHASLALAHGK